MTAKKENGDLLELTDAELLDELGIGERTGKILLASQKLHEREKDDIFATFGKKLGTLRGAVITGGGLIAIGILLASFFTLPRTVEALSNKQTADVETLTKVCDGHERRLTILETIAKDTREEASFVRKQLWRLSDRWNVPRVPAPAHAPPLEGELP